MVLNQGSLLWLLCFNHADTSFYCIYCPSEGRHTRIIVLFKEAESCLWVKHALSSIVTIGGVSSLPYRVRLVLEIHYVST